MNVERQDDFQLVRATRHIDEGEQLAREMMRVIARRNERRLDTVDTQHCLDSMLHELESLRRYRDVLERRVVVIDTKP